MDHTRIIVANHGLIRLIKFIAQSCTELWKDFTNILYLVLYACMICWYSMHIKLVVMLDTIVRASSSLTTSTLLQMFPTFKLILLLLFTDLLQNCWFDWLYCVDPAYPNFKSQIRHCGSTYFRNQQRLANYNVVLGVVLNSNEHYLGFEKNVAVS
jgi:hypothetical protein